MIENAEPSKSPLEKPAKTPQRFKKGVSGNPNGRPKGSISKSTRLRQLLTSGMQDQAAAVVKNVIQKAKKGSVEHEKMVLAMLQPFIKREAERDGGPKNQRPLVNITVNKTEGRVEVKPARIIEHEA